MQIPSIRGYNEDVLMLVILTTTYAKKALVMVSSKIIDRAMKVITKGELARAKGTWKQAPFGVVMSGSLQLPHTHAGGRALTKGLPLSTTTIPTVPKEFHLDDVQGHIHTTKRIMIPPFRTVNIHGQTDV